MYISFTKTSYDKIINGKIEGNFTTSTRITSVDCKGVPHRWEKGG